MRTKQAIAKKLNVPTAQVWDAIRDIGHLNVWFPIIASCRVEGSGAGAHRYMTLEEGGEITELIEAISDADKRLTYLRTESPFPVTHYRGTVEVFDSYDAQAIVVWTIDLDSPPEASAPVADLVKNAIGDGIDGMEKDLRARLN